MPPRNRTRLALVLGAAAVAVALLLSGRGWIVPRLLAVDESERSALADAAAARVRSVLRHSIDELARTCEDWAAWDSMYEFLKTRSDEFLRENFYPQAAASLGLSRVLLLDLNGVVVARQDYDMLAGCAAEYSAGPGVALGGLDGGSFRQGCTMGPDGRPSWYSLRPVRRSDRSGPHLGYLLMVRPILDADLARLGEMTGTTIRFSAPGVPGDAGSRLFPLRGAGDADLGALRASIDPAPLNAAHEARRGVLLQAVTLGLLACGVLIILLLWSWWMSPSGAGADGMPRAARGYIPMATCLGLGLGVSFLAYHLALQWQRGELESEFARRSRNQATIIEHALQGRMDALRTLQRFADRASEITEEGFAAFAGGLHESDRGTRAYAWAPRSDPAPGAPLRIAQVWPAAPNREVIGLDLHALPEAAEAMRRACDTGESIATRPLALPGGGTGSVLFVAPCYQPDRASDLPEHRRQALRGFVVLRLDMPDFLRAAQEGVDSRLHVRVYQTDDSPPAGADTGKLLLARAIALAGREWTLEMRPGPAFHAPGTGPLPAVLLTACTLVTLLLTAYLAAVRRQAGRTQSLVELRTRELVAANRAAEVLNTDLRDSLDQKARLTDELARARDQADAASRAKSEFLANMSHEIRTPMTAILGHSELLSDPTTGPADRETAVDAIQRNGRHLLTLINDLLDFSKIEAGGMTVERIACNPADVIRDAVRSLRPADPELTLTLEFATPIPNPAHTDPTRLRQILVNLVGNAIKFTKRGSVRVVAGVENSRTLRIAVHDTGIGLDPAARSRLFRPFSQADGSTSRRFGGTGLGLSISRRLAHLLGGDITAEGTPGNGSVFAVTIDIAPEESRAEHGSGQSPNGGPDPRLRGRILLAEDGADNRRLLSFLLRRAGAAVDIAEDGQIAVEMATAPGHHYDLVLMDMQMPELDGYGATRTLRLRGYGGPIVALTANAMAGDRERCMAIGCNDYLIKPIERSTLIRACACWLPARTAAA